MNFSDHQEIEVVASPRSRSVSALRWWIGGLLFASTVINYIDRQTLSLLAPYLKVEYHWSNTDYANLVIAFRVAYSIGQTVFGRFRDRGGTRSGSRNMSADWRLPSLTADHRLAAPSLPSSFCGFIFDGDGVQHLSSQDC